MEHLLEQSALLLRHPQPEFKRFLHHKIQWENRLIGIKGARGTGKTTLLLQWLKALNLPPTKAAYFSLDDLYFTKHSLKETVDQYYKQGGEVLILDEVHKYDNWAKHIKNSYDFYPDLKIIFTGSSIIDISKQQADLSRRALIYELPGLSYREFLALKHGIQFPSVTLEDIITDGDSIAKEITRDFRPLSLFQDYLSKGYYPFIMEDQESVHHRINQVIRTIIEYDMAELKNFDVRNAKKVLQLMYVISQQVPFKPNLVSLASKTSIHRNTLNSYLHYLQEAKLITLLLPFGKSTAVLQKPEKIFLNNTNLIFALADGKVESGNVRETFFLSQLCVSNTVEMPKKGDFMVNNKYTFEVGGKSKGFKQIEGLENAWIVKDDLEYPVGKQIPLWMFGFLY